MLSLCRCHAEAMPTPISGMKLAAIRCVVSNVMDCMGTPPPTPAPPGGGGGICQGDWAIGTVSDVQCMLCIVNPIDMKHHAAAANHAHLLCRGKVFFGCGQVCLLPCLALKAALRNAALCFSLTQLSLKGDDSLLHSRQHVGLCKGVRHAR